MRDGTTGQRRIPAKVNANLPILTDISFSGGCQVASQQLPVAQSEADLKLGPDLSGWQALRR